MANNFKKYSLILIFVICVCVAVGFALFACNKVEYKARFVVDGEEYDVQTLGAGEQLSAPATPTTGANGEFDGWYADAEFGGDKAEFPMEMPAKDVTFYGRILSANTVGYTVQYYLQKLNADNSATTDEYELSAETYVGSGEVGETVYLPTKIIKGFLKVSHEGDVQSVTLGEDESQNVMKVYMDRAIYSVVFEADGGNGEMPTRTYPYGATVPGDIFVNAFTREGYNFAGFLGEYEDGSPIPLGSFRIQDNATFTAQWHRGYNNAAGNGEVAYFDGQTFYILEDGSRRSADGVSQGSQLGREYLQFTFELDGGEFVGRVYDGASAYEVRGDEAGEYIRYDYVMRGTDDEYVGETLALDGFGFATYSTLMVGGTLGTEYAGTYFKDDERNDYEFDIINLTTFAQIGTDHFALSKDLPQDLLGSGLAGSFVICGYESGAYVEYSLMDRTLGDRQLWLGGYGYARLMSYNAQDDAVSTKISEGIYKGTEYYADESGEWLYQPADPADGEAFKFATSVIGIDGGYLPVYMVYDERLDCVLTEANGGGVLTIGGYNGAVYRAGGDVEYGGAISVLAEGKLQFTPYVDGEALEPMIFDVNWDSQTFELSSDVFVVDNGILTRYIGSSTIVTIPDGVTEVAANVFNYTETGVSLTYVRIPSSVTIIGARAFENNNTLTTAVFDGMQPISIDWSSANNPFRWPATGAFKIYVPNEALQAYKAAWSDCPYTITSVEEQTDKPLYEVEKGVLLSYNNKDEAPHDVAVVLPDEVERVAAGVFAHISYIVSVDLKNATEVGNGAFTGCAGLASVTADNLQVVGVAAFANCTALQSVSLPAVRELGEQAFAGDYILNRASLGADIQHIDANAFFGCGADIYPTLFTLELAANSNIPVIGEHAFDPIGYRVSVATVDDALRLYTSSGRGWTVYASRATVRENEASAISGEWVDVTSLNPARIGGRLELDVQGDIFIYRLTADSLTIYSYSQGDYTEISATYADGKICFESPEGQAYALVRREGELTFAGADGETLVVDLTTYYAGEQINEDGTTSGYTVRANATFCGQAGEINVMGNAKVMTDVKVSGINCNLSFTLNADGTFGYRKEQNDSRGPYTAADGSSVKLEFWGENSASLTGKLMQFKNANGDPIVAADKYSWMIVERPADNVYIVSAMRLNDRYRIIVTIDEAAGTFTYSVQLASAQKVLRSADGRLVLLMLTADGEISDISIVVPSLDRTETLHALTFERQTDGSYLVHAEQRDIPGEGEAGELSGWYRVRITDMDGGTCEVEYLGKQLESGV